MYEQVSACRVCGNQRLETVVDLGMQAYTGIFPKSADTDVPVGPLQLYFCDQCNLTQLAHRFDASMMYGENYGYRSGLNASMVNHLSNKVQWLTGMVGLNPGDYVLDIGSNDGTTLGSYTVDRLKLIGIDPTGAKFRQYYKPGIELVPDFFTAENWRSIAADAKAKLVTSIAMFYDLEDPTTFARDIRSILDDDGVWHFEQSYMPLMLRYNSFDTICHEHASYYTLRAVKNILDKADLRIIDVRINDINGGSFAVTAVPNGSKRVGNESVVDWMLEQEQVNGLSTSAPLHAFAGRLATHAAGLRSLLARLADDGRKVIGYGASTKGNVILQYCRIDSSMISAIAEINPDKFGCVTPGTHIPIIADADARAMQPDYFVVLPWHFRDSILAREQDFFRRGGRLIFPMPETEIV